MSRQREGATPQARPQLRKVAHDLQVVSTRLVEVLDRYHQLNQLYSQMERGEQCDLTNVHLSLTVGQVSLPVPVAQGDELLAVLSHGVAGFAEQVLATAAQAKALSEDICSTCQRAVAQHETPDDNGEAVLAQASSNGQGVLGS